MRIWGNKKYMNIQGRAEQLTYLGIQLKHVFMFLCFPTFKDDIRQMVFIILKTAILKNSKF